MSERTKEEIQEDLAAKMRRRGEEDSPPEEPEPQKTEKKTSTKTKQKTTKKSQKLTEEEKMERNRQKYGTRFCDKCGLEYVPKKPNQRYCDNCRKSIPPENLVGDKSGIATCVICGKEFETKDVAKAKYCSKTCTNKANTKAYHDRKEVKSDNEKMVKVRCQNPECPNGGYFETTWKKYRGGKKFCDRKCQGQYNYLNSKKYKREQEEKKNSAPEAEQVAEVDYKPHSGGQQEVHNSTARFKCLICGARWGKDRCLINEAIVKIAQMLNENRPTTLIPRVHFWLVAPTYPLAKQIWRELIHFWPEQWRIGKNEAEHRLETIGDGLIEVKSADNPDSLVSVGLDGVLVTEAARIKDLETTWSYLRGRLSSPGRGPGGKGGIALINSTPKGRNFLYQMYQWGLDENFPDWDSFQFPTEANPYIPKEEIEEAKKTLPERMFRQEYLGEFLEDSGEVFPNVDEVSTGVFQEPVPGMTYKAAWDPAQRNDYSAFGIRNERGEQVVRERWTGIPWTMQLGKVEYYCKKYNNAPLDIDATGLGETLPEAAAQRNLLVTGHFFTNPFKEQLVTHFSLLMENRDIILIDDKAQKEELKAFTYSFTKTGKISYHHPTGGHDDLVMMLLLLYQDFNVRELSLPFMGLLTGTNLNGKKTVVNY